MAEASKPREAPIPRPGAAPAPHAVVRLDNVVKSFGETVALGGVSLEIRRGEYFSLLGPSGCGKTTLLRVIAGLETPDAGRVHIDGNDVTQTPAHRRPVNTVFQSYALFPHFSVFDNVAFGLRQDRIARRQVASRVAEALSLVALDGLARRKPHELSGGQQQRVALARALVKRPKLLLLDEPMAALDRSLRERTQAELARIQRTVGVTFVMVTHDQQEAMDLSSRIGVMRDGMVEQVGTPRDVYERPASRFVAEYSGPVNLYRARLETRGPPGPVVVVSALGCRVSAPATAADLADCWVVLRPENVDVRARLSTGSDVDVAPGRVERVSYLGGRWACVVRTHAGGSIRAVLSATSPSSPPLAPGAEVCACWEASAPVVLPS